MKATFKTNIDKYRQIEWPIFDHVPSKGEIVYVPRRFFAYCDSNNIPKRLEIVRIEYDQEYKGEYFASCELWFNELDYKAFGGGEKLLK